MLRNEYNISACSNNQKMFFFLHSRASPIALPLFQEFWKVRRDGSLPWPMSSNLWCFWSLISWELADPNTKRMKSGSGTSTRRAGTLGSPFEGLSWELRQLDSYYFRFVTFIYFYWQLGDLKLKEGHLCYSSVKCKSNFIELFHKVKLLCKYTSI